MDRRQFIMTIQSLMVGSLLSRSLLAQSLASQDSLILKAIPKTGEKIPVIGMGTWLTFNVGKVPGLLDQRAQILKAFFDNGGRVIDSSPMYGSAEFAIGRGLEKLEGKQKVFSATKIWTSAESEGPQQFKDSQEFWKEDPIDLEQIHNLVNWESHLPYLRKLKEKGKVRYIGVTTSHGRRHDELYRLMKKEDLDFVQLTYNVDKREAEERLIPLAQEKNIAVIANRPFGGGQVIDKVQESAFPEWAKELGLKNWPEVLLKFIISHPGVHVAIPATSKVEHMKENMGASHGKLLTKKERSLVQKEISKVLRS